MTSVGSVKMDYRSGIKEALSSVQSAHSGYACSDVVTFEGLKALPSISVEGVGKVFLPVRQDQQGRIASLYIPCNV
jgi:hypothetical protein